MRAVFVREVPMFGQPLSEWCLSNPYSGEKALLTGYSPAWQAVCVSSSQGSFLASISDEEMCARGMSRTQAENELITRLGYRPTFL